MKEKRLLEALSEVNDKFVEEIDFENVDDRIDKQKDSVSSKQRFRKKNWMKWIGVVAAFALAFVVFIGETDLFPKETSKNYFSASTINGTASLEKDEPFLTKNPWMKGLPETQYPVYKNLAFVSVAGEPGYFSREELLEMAKQVADGLDTEVIEWSYIELTEKNAYSDVCEISAKTDIAEIRVMGNGKISIFFYEEIELPEEYQFSDENTYMEAVQLVRYLTEKYAALLGFENAADDCSMYYDLTGYRNLSYSAYNVASEESDSIIEYCFQRASFYGDENGLSIIRYGDVRVAVECLGDYEIISAEEARARLEEGNYISVLLTEAEAIGGTFTDDNIIHVELTYLTGSTCQYYQPYYCFYVETESLVEGISSYGTFYVPALTDEDLERFPEENPIGN